MVCLFPARLLCWSVVFAVVVEFEPIFWTDTSAVSPGPPRVKFNNKTFKFELKNLFQSILLLVVLKNVKRTMSPKVVCLLCVRAALATVQPHCEIVGAVRHQGSPVWCCGVSGASAALELCAMCTWVCGVCCVCVCVCMGACLCGARVCLCVCVCE